MYLSNPNMLRLTILLVRFRYILFIRRIRADGRMNRFHLLIQHSYIFANDRQRINSLVFGWFNGAAVMDRCHLLRKYRIMISALLHELNRLALFMPRRAIHARRSIHAIGNSLSSLLRDTRHSRRGSREQKVSKWSKMGVVKAKSLIFLLLLLYVLDKLLHSSYLHNN